MFAWTENNVASLRGHVASGKSSGYAATALDPTGHLTRNAVTSKAQKLGLRFNSRASGAAEKPQPRRRRRSAHSEEMLAQYAGGRLPPVAFTPNPASTDGSEIPVDQRKALIELEPRDCRWPFGDPQASGFFFCAAPAIHCGSYCSAHSRIAYNLPRHLGVAA